MLCFVQINSVLLNLSSKERSVIIKFKKKKKQKKKNQFPEQYYYKFKQYITDRTTVIIGLSIRKFVLIFFTSIVIYTYFNEGVLLF